jgi:ABC-2 type transport system permease protein
MLWYKAWLETRARFLISLLGIAAMCSYIVYHGNDNALSYTKLSYYYLVLHSGHVALCTLWMVAVTLLMMGGLLREKAVGAASFTLALPVTRGRLMLVRIGMGILQAVALAVIPWASMFVTALRTGKAHDPAQAGFHLVLLLGGGILFLATALLLSSIVEGEYTAPVATFGVIALISVAFGEGPLRSYSPLLFMNGVDQFDRHTGLLTGPIPWLQASASLAIAALLMLLSIKIIDRREF